jgi:hypothetical protein
MMGISLIHMFDKVASTLAMFSFLIVVAKFITKRIKNTEVAFFKKLDTYLNLKKLDTYIMKIHKPAAIVLIISAVIHGIFSAWSISRVGILPFIIGIICGLSCILSAVFFYLRKKFQTPKSWIIYHRLFTAIAIIALIGHIMLA